MNEKQENMKNGTCYDIKCFCKNCNDIKKIKIPKGRPFTDYPCPDCKVLALINKKEILTDQLDANEVFLKLLEQNPKLKNDFPPLKKGD